MQDVDETNSKFQFDVIIVGYLILIVFKGVFNRCVTNIAMTDWPRSPGYQLHQKGIPQLVPSSLQPFHDLQEPEWRIRLSVSDAS